MVKINISDSKDSVTHGQLVLDTCNDVSKTRFLFCFCFIYIYMYIY